MNKSKFLKKSLAMLLAVMMVVAMIPLGASAAGNKVTVNDGTVVDLSTSTGKLETTDKTNFTDTLPYNVKDNTAGSNEVITVSLHANTGFDHINYKLDNGSVVPGADNANTITILKADLPDQGKSKSLVIFASKGAYDESTTKAEDVSKNYTITLTTSNPSSKFDIKEAVVEIASPKQEVKATVDNAKKLISVSMPWGQTTGTLKITQEATGTTPVSDVSITKLDEDPEKPTTKVNVYNQLGQRTQYTVSVVEAECLTTLTVGGVAATAKLDKDGKPVLQGGNEIYEVVLPEDTKVDGTGASEVVKEQLNVVAKSAIDNAKVKWNDVLMDGKTVVVKTGADNTVEFEDAKGNKKTYCVKVSVKDSEDASIESATVEAFSDYAQKWFVENCTVEGDQIKVVLPYKSDLKKAIIDVKAAKGATVTYDPAGTPVAAGTDTTHPDAYTKYDLTNPVRVTVEAADGKTTKYYFLSATTAENPNGKPTITAGKMTIGKEEYTATISGTTITFSNLPYVTTATDIKGNATATPKVDPAKFDWGKSFATTISDITYGNDIFKDKNTITITSDDRASVPYTVVFSLAPAETGKTLSNVKFIDATKAENVTVDNTYTATVASNKITANLPYSYDKGTPASNELVYQFDLSKGAKLYRLDTTTLTELKSGFYTKEEAEADETGATKEGAIKGDTNTSAELAAKYAIKYYVADETLVKLIKETTVDGSNITTNEKAKGHYTALTSAVKFDAAQTGFTLNSITDSDGKVTSKTNGNTAIEITVPYSYVGADKAFFPVITKSKMAELTINGTSTVLDPTKADKDAVPAVTGKQYMQVVVDDPAKGTYKLQLTDLDANGDPTGPATVVTKIKVTNEAKSDDTTYAVTVKVAPAKTEALVKTFKVNNTSATSIDNTNMAIKVNLPANSDPTQVTLEATVSEMATITLYKKDGTAVSGMTAVEKLTTPKDTTMDITSVDTVSVTAEDTKTTNTYTLTVTVNELKFIDVKPGWAYDGIMKAAAAGVVSGYPLADGTLEFRPNNSITRGEFASMVTRLMVNNGLATQADIDAAKNPFKDSNVGWAGFNSSIGYLASKGIVSGKGSTSNFAPTDNITRQEAAIIVAKALTLQTASNTKYADDAKIASWAKTFVYQCRQAGVMVGDGKNFNPTNNLSRQEAAVTLAAKIK